MKKIFFLLFSLSSLGSNGQTEDSQLLQDFVNSVDYNRFMTNSQFSSNGNVNLLYSNVHHQEHPSIDGKIVPVLNVNFTQNLNGEIKIVGQIQAIKVREDYTRLPNMARYIMLYRDFRQYNHNTMTGTINVYDLNYDEYLVGIGNFTKGVADNFDTFPMPSITVERYDLGLERPHFCDGNQNGNVTWGECWRCMINACLGNSTCTALCMFGNHFGNQQCSLSVAISCTWIAIWY